MIRKTFMAKMLLIITTFFISQLEIFSCTNFLVTKGASADGSTYLTYTADAGGFMEKLYFHAGGKHNTGDSVEIYEWDSGWKKFLGKIPQVSETYRVIGNMNEYQLSIGETTFGGRPELQDTTGIIDYGNLIYLTLQRAKTAKEAIKIMTDLVANYGYYSGGESISIVDPNEVWILEIVGKAGKEKGAIWIARKIPDGYVSAHANTARIRDMIENNPNECLYANDIITFAEKMGYYDKTKGIPFAFADVYAPIMPSDLFACDSRVWALFNRSAPSLNLSPDYFRAVEGAKPYPLYVKPDNPLTTHNVMMLMRDHFEGTEFDMTKGTAAGPYGNPYRWKPLEFKLSNDTTTSYYWERPISTQQTAFSFVAQMRNNMPREIGGVFWYGLDDSYSTVYTPLYCCITDVTTHYKSANIDKLDLNSTAWIFNMVANIAYNMYSIIIPDVVAVQTELETKYLNSQKTTELAALELYKVDKNATIEYLTNYSMNQGENTYERWYNLWSELIVKYNDRYINDVNVNAGRSPKSAYYGNGFYEQVTKERPGYYEMKWKKPVKK